MAIALMGAGFSATDTSDAVNILYPITMTVQANKAWQASGLKKSFFGVFGVWHIYGAGASVFP
ncbi:MULTISPECIES: hypothetical protein [unclassified Providencia]|uniref:hypothetical protein n=1 Tax=unclassified Providencia TaxID=2633465 RepID=UPI00234AC485|nr:MULTISPECIES: hypothetical protein [unclassified Providencia]